MTKFWPLQHLEIRKRRRFQQDGLKKNSLWSRKKKNQGSAMCLRQIKKGFQERTNDKWVQYCCKLTKRFSGMGLQR